MAKNDDAKTGADEKPKDGAGRAAREVKERQAQW